MTVPRSRPTSPGIVRPPDQPASLSEFQASGAVSSLSSGEKISSPRHPGRHRYLTQFEHARRLATPEEQQALFRFAGSSLSLSRSLLTLSTGQYKDASWQAPGDDPRAFWLVYSFREARPAEIKSAKIKGKQDRTFYVRIIQHDTVQPVPGLPLRFRLAIKNDIMQKFLASKTEVVELK